MYKENFKAFNYTSSIEILRQAQKRVGGEVEPTLFIFAGANASGKSTLIANLYSQGKLAVPYVNADLYTKYLFNNIKDEEERNKTGMFYTMDKVNSMIQCKKSFAYETVLSHPSKIDMFIKAKENGYKIKSVFVKTENPKINLERLALRVSQGGHNVPEDKVIARYYRSYTLSRQLEEISDEFEIFDNTKTLEIYSSKENENLNQNKNLNQNDNGNYNDNQNEKEM